MRKITRLAVNAFMNGTEFSMSNTEVSINGNMYLHGNNIARKGLYYGVPIIHVTTAGWNTKTTRERLNGIPWVHVQVKKGKLFLNGEEWNGEWKEIIIPFTF